MRYKIEERRERGMKEEVVLAAVKLAGILALTAVAPNALQLLAKKKKKPTLRDKYYLSEVTDRLIKQGKLKVDYQGMTSLTDKGLQSFVALETQIVQRPKKWDGKYRVVIFDIEETRKKQRDLIRSQLMSLGFEKLQNSVWISPYECEEIINLMKANQRLSNSIIYMTVESIENDLWLQQKFRLVEID